MPPGRLDLVGRGVSEARHIPLNGAGGHVEDEMPNEGLCQQLIARIRFAHREPEGAAEAE